MAGHALPDFETKDVYGKTLQFETTVGVSPVNFPAAPEGDISEFLIRNPDNNGVNDKIFVSLDGGVNFLRLGRGEFLGWTPKNNASNTPIEQIVVKASSANRNVEIIVNVEP